MTRTGTPLATQRLLLQLRPFRLPSLSRFRTFCFSSYFVSRSTISIPRTTSPLFLSERISFLLLVQPALFCSLVQSQETLRKELPLLPKVSSRTPLLSPPYLISNPDLRVAEFLPLPELSSRVPSIFSLSLSKPQSLFSLPISSLFLFSSALLPVF